MNAIVSFRLCKLSDEELSGKVDEMTDNLYEVGPEKIISRHVPARPDEDYDLIVGELIVRFGEVSRELKKSKDLFVAAKEKTGALVKAIEKSMPIVNTGDEDDMEVYHAFNDCRIFLDLKDSE